MDIPNGSTTYALRKAVEILNKKLLTVEADAAAGKLTPQQQLTAWVRSNAYTIVLASYSPAGVMSSADIKWPDGTSGTFTGTINTTYQTIDSFQFTYNGVVTYTITQPTITRNSSGYITTTPDLVITP